jgi:hypothetical protein
MAATCGGRLAPESDSGWVNRALLVLALASVGVGCAGGGSGGSGGASPRFTYRGAATWIITGAQGGPFSNASNIAVLENPGSRPVAWSATSVPAFVQLDQLTGVISPNTQVSIHADLNAGVAQTLTLGDYPGTLTFHNDSAPQPDIGIGCALLIQPPASGSRLLPATDFASQGAATGPFQPDSTVYRLTNTGSTALSWQASAPDAWVSIAPASGQLAPSGSVDVVVSINDPETGTLSMGMHQSVVEIRDAVDSAVLHSRSVDLNVLTDPPSGGWTVFTPSVDTRTVYVSSSTGNDANNGLSPVTARRTVAAGKALLRDGFPDWLLLKCGDTWDESLNTNGEFRLNGRSLAERMLVSSYGTGARPLLRTGTGTGVDNFTQGNHIAIVGLHFWAHTYTGQGTPRGVQWLGATANFLLEDCFIEAYETNVVVMGYPEPTHRQSNVTIRRNVIVDAYNTGSSNSQGIFASGTDGLLMEENVLDRNGWNDTIPGSLPTWYRRNVYIQNGCTGVTLRGNILARTEGAQMRSGGSVEENLFLHLPIAVLLGGGMIPEAQGVTGTMHHNVMLDGGDLQPGSPRGWGMWLSNLSQATIDSNVIAHNVSGHAPYPVTFDVALNGRGVENTVFSNNIIYAWNGYSRFKGTAAQTVNIQLLDNKLQNEITSDPLIVHDQAGSTNGVISANNVFHCLLPENSWMQAGPLAAPFTRWKSLVHDTGSIAQQVVFPDPTRTIGTYHASIGGAPTLDAFMTEARNQSKANWRGEYTARAVNAYIRAGFGL